MGEIKIITMYITMRLQDKNKVLVTMILLLKLECKFQGLMILHLMLVVVQNMKNRRLLM